MGHPSGVSRIPKCADCGAFLKPKEVGYSSVQIRRCDKCYYRMKERIRVTVRGKSFYDSAEDK